MNRIKELRKERRITQKELAKHLQISDSTLSYWEQGKYEPDNTSLSLLADYFRVSVDYLIGRSDYRTEEDVADAVSDVYSPRMREWNRQGFSGEKALKKEEEFQKAAYEDVLRENMPAFKNIKPLPKTKKIPLLGKIACGQPITAVENIEDYIDVDENINCSFALECKGDSMINARIFDGDTVYIREQPDVENGEIAAVLIDNDATLKRVYKYPDKIVLRPENPTYNDLIYNDAELDEIRILGKAVAFLSKVR